MEGDSNPLDPFADPELPPLPPLPDSPTPLWDMPTADNVLDDPADPDPLPFPVPPTPSSKKAYVEDDTEDVEHTTSRRDGAGVESGRPAKNDQEKTSAQPKSKGRNLVVCIDGTANQFGLKNTHVVELYSRLVADETQLTYYNSGIATYVAESNIVVRIIQLIIHWLDMAFAWGHAEITLKAYQWLSENYVPGDRIYLFGFSRGAYQVRIISGMIKIVGLLRKGNNEQIRFAYQLYLAMIIVMERMERESQASKTDTPLHEPVNETIRICAQFKRSLSHPDFIVHFVGVWDTVSSIGLTRGPSFPETTSGMLHVRAFRHALAMNERRGKFQPEYANGGCGPQGGGDVKEVWFVGSHSDIGGGNMENIELDSFGPPLRWMMYEAIQHGLLVQPYQGNWGAVQHNPSMNRVWRFFEYLPFKRLAYDGKDSNAVIWWPPNLGSGRRVQVGQLIHESVKEYFATHTDPADRTNALIQVDGSWVPIEEHLNDASSSLKLVFEEDAYSKVVTFIPARLSKHIEKDELPSKELSEQILDIMSGPTKQFLLDAFTTAEHANNLLDALRLTNGAPPEIDNAEKRADLARAFAQILVAFPSRPNECSTRNSLQLASWLRCVDEDDCRRIMVMFGSFQLTGHANTVLAVAYSPNGKLIASSSADATIRLWDARTGHPVGEPLRGHTGVVYSVAFSPDGAHIASGSDDKTIRIWDVATQQPVGSPLTGHDSYVYSVAFSPDGKHIVSGSFDKTVRVWEAETGSAVGEPLRGHADWVQSVAISPDGRQIASGSGDGTVRIWDFETRKAVRELKGHSDTVRSVAFTPDGKRVVSGSDDSTIRVWDVESGETVLGPLRGHEYWVYAVAVSSDGKYIASGADDATVRLWDAETGEPAGEPLRGHKNPVTSVAFSPDGRRVVSGSFDRTLMIWDVDVPASTSTDIS